MSRQIRKMIISTIRCPETGLKIGRYGCITNLMPIPGTCWYIAKFGKTLRILEFCEIRGKEQKTKREFILTLEKRPKAEREYKHIDLYEAKLFALHIEDRMCTLQFHNPKEIWEDLYIEETKDTVYYIIVG